MAETKFSPGWAKKFLMVTAGLFFLAIATMVVWQITGPTWFKNIKAEITNQPYARTITVDGEGKVTAKPDIAIINLSVVSQGKTVKEVTLDGNKKMTAVIGEVKKLGVDEKDVVTSSYNLYPDYAYPENRQPQIRGYSLTQGITVKVRKLDTVDDVLDVGIKAGANQVGQLSFDIDEDSALKKEARDIAFKKAREKADQMASAAGVSIGRVITFSEGYAPPVPVYRGYDMAYTTGAEIAPAPSIEPGSKELTVTVSVTYEIQ
jgi:uncharacterized protein YggE